jgi:hypothetical protein
LYFKEINNKNQRQLGCSVAVIVSETAISRKPLKKIYKWIIKKGRAILPHPCARKRKGEAFMFQAHNTYRQKNNYVYTKYYRRGVFSWPFNGSKAEVRACYFQFTDNFI